MWQGNYAKTKVPISEKLFPSPAPYPRPIRYPQTFVSATEQIRLGGGNGGPTTLLSGPTPASGNRVYTFADPGSDASLWLKNSVNPQVISGTIVFAGGVSAQGLNTVGLSTATYPSIAALRANSIAGLQSANVLGYSTSTDGGGDFFFSKPYDTTSSDNGGTIFVDGFGARWYRQYETLNVRHFGAHGDGATDDTASIQTALNFSASSSASVRFTSGTYRVTSTLNIASNCDIVIEDGATVQLYLASAPTPTTARVFGQLSYAQPLTNVSISGGGTISMTTLSAPSTVTLVGSAIYLYANTVSLRNFQVTAQFGACITLRGTTIACDNLSFEAPMGSGIYYAGGEYLRLTELQFDVGGTAITIAPTEATSLTTTLDTHYAIVDTIDLVAAGKILNCPSTGINMLTITNVVGTASDLVSVSGSGSNAIYGLTFESFDITIPPTSSFHAWTFDQEGSSQMTDVLCKDITISGISDGPSTFMSAYGGNQPLLPTSFAFRNIALYTRTPTSGISHLFGAHFVKLLTVDRLVCSPIAGLPSTSITPSGLLLQGVKTGVITACSFRQLDYGNYAITVDGCSHLNMTNVYLSSATSHPLLDVLNFTNTNRYVHLNDLDVQDCVYGGRLNTVDWTSQDNNKISVVRGTQAGDMFTNTVASDTLPFDDRGIPIQVSGNDDGVASPQINTITPPSSSDYGNPIITLTFVPNEGGISVGDGVGNIQLVGAFTAQFGDQLQLQYNWITSTWTEWSRQIIPNP